MRVRLLVWAVTDRDAQEAVCQAGARPSRAGWMFAVERVGGARCPIDVTDPGSIAAEVGDRWVYAVYPAAAGVGS